MPSGKRLARMRVGDMFSARGQRWVVLEVRRDSLIAFTLDFGKSAVFGWRVSS